VSASAVAARPVAPRGTSPPLRVQIGVIARRSVLRTVRRLAVIGPTILFPLFFLALNSNALKKLAVLPHFPTKSYLTFALSSTFVLAGMTTVSIAGGTLAEDIRTGFLDRLRLTPLRGAALVLGHLAGTAFIALLGAVLYLVVGVIAGAKIKTGIPGAVVIVLLAIMIAVAFASFGVLAALIRPDAVQVVFPLLFVSLFLSSQYLPRNLIASGWFRTVATYNPMSYLIEAPRSLLISGWDGQALALGGGIASLFIAIAVLLSSARLRGTVHR
jgi:ABC-2 type transport system permease protein